jgi:hypothetical protein
VWETKEQADAFNRDVVWPAMRATGAPEGGPEPEVVEFDARAILTGDRYSFPTM